MSYFEMSLSGMVYCTSLEAERWLKDPDEVEPNLALIGKPIKKPSSFAKELNTALTLRPVAPGMWWVIYWHDPMEKPSYIWSNGRKEIEIKLGELLPCARFIQPAVAPFSGWVENETWEENGVIHQSFIHPHFPFLKTDIQGLMVKFSILK